jgi:polyketide cyclase/dehydrase/lipid transport protein
MWQSEVSIDIQVPVEQVFDRLSDFTRHSDFSSGLAKVEQLTPEPPGVGTRYRSQETVPGKYVSYCEITALEEPRRIAWKAWVPHVMRTKWEYRLTPDSRGPLLVQVSRWWPSEPIGFVMLHLHRKRHAARENQASLQRIRALLDAESVVASRVSGT